MFAKIDVYLYADAQNTYYWLKLRDKRIAEEFAEKMDRAEKLIDKKVKAKEMLKNSYTWTADYTKADENLKKALPWYRRLFFKRFNK